VHFGLLIGAIATSLLEHLADHTHLSIATTHFGELKTLKYQNSQFENASVEFDDVQLAPTYKLFWGIPGRSNALAIARRLGLPENIIASAQNYVGYGSTEINLVISELEAQRRRQTDKAKATATLLSEMEKLHREISDKSQQLRSQYQDLRANQEIEITAAINQAKKEIARVIRKLQAGDQSPQSAQHADQRMAQIGRMHLPSQQKQSKILVEELKYIPKLGDQVKVTKLNKVGQILSIPNNSGEVSVRLGTMKMTVKVEDIEEVKG
jgi:DNA mismatch repair protein MutS2